MIIAFTFSSGVLRKLKRERLGSLEEEIINSEYWNVTKYIKNETFRISLISDNDLV